MTKKKEKNTLVFSIFTLTFAAAAAAAAILNILSQSSFWKFNHEEDDVDNHEQEEEEEEEAKSTRRRKRVPSLSFWEKKIKKINKMKKMKKTIQLKKKEKPNPGGGGGGEEDDEDNHEQEEEAKLIHEEEEEKTSIFLSSPGPDRISELPKEILVHILGLLEMDELLIGTSLVSTKWRNLWKSVSTLNFPSCSTLRRRNDDDSVVVVDNGGGGGGIRNNVEKYQNFVDHVLRLRDSEASKIRIFRYYYLDDSQLGSCSERLHNFIVSAAVNQGAQEIHIFCSHLHKNSDNMMIHFNPSIFTSGLLRKFTFQVLLINRDFQIQFPRSMCSCATTQLTHLTLYGIRLPEGDDATAELHLVSPVLETFHMSCCSSKHLKVLDISAPRLDTLSICNIGMRNAYFDALGGCRIEIRTPNLTSLHYEGDVYVDCFTENLPRIANATLKISKERGGMVETTTSFAIKLLKGLTSAESLTLEGFEVVSQNTLKDLLKPFTGLRTLELVTNCNISSIHGMVHFLNSCSSVEKLLLVWKEDEFVEVEGDEHLMLPQCRLSHLKYVHIQRMRGHENEIEFVKFLLKSSVVLEDLIIKVTKNSRMKKIKKNLKQFIEEEPSFRSIKLCVLREEHDLFYYLSLGHSKPVRRMILW